MKDTWREEKDGKIYVRTCGWSPPGDHPVGCGMILTVKDGKLIKVEGDPEHPISQGRLCPRCLAMKEFIDSPTRIKYPMKRAKEDRGKDTWERITWDEALDIIEKEVRQIWENYGPESILLFQGTGRESTLYAPAMGSAVLGTPNFCFSMSGASCYGPRTAVADFLLGAGYPELDYAQFFPDRYDNPEYEIPKYIILWGKSPLQSNPDGFYGHSLIDLMKRGSKIITIDPRLTWLGTRAAYHLQLRPGTDTALGLAMLNVIITEDLYDHDFCENWVFGLDELKERVKDKTPEWAEEITWVPAETIREATRAFATNRPSSIMWGLAIDEQQNGVQAGQVLLSIAAICGYMDVPGGVVLAKPSSFMGKWRFECSKYIDPEVAAKRIDGKEQYPAYAAGPMAHPDLILEALDTGKPYPLKMMYFYATNPLAGTCWGEPERWAAHMRKMDFNVVQDCFMTPTAMAFADIFLPVSGFAEHDGVVLPHFGRNTHFLGAMNAALDPGEAKSDIEINIALGKRLNPEAWPWDTAAEFFTDQIHTMYDWDFDDLRDMGVFQQANPYYKYEKGLLREDGEPGFNTPTGLIEVSTCLYEDFGEDPLPYFQEPPYSPVSTPEIAEDYPYVLTTGGRDFVSFHSEHRQIPSLRSITPDAIVTIHPETAKKHGIKDGDWVEIKNMYGKCVEKARLTYEVMPQVVHATHGWWYPEQDSEAPNLYGVYKSNINKLIPYGYNSKLGYGAPYKSMLCSIRKVDSLEG
ncbi:molybdopterin-dependent oxidoreductase [Adlercreutzia sp. ZJ154]|uniref:molybdopterin-containing oxidoreductase family protein n=1 Tax=Adlercreutzia sp. ZJ154 TaxID=2709790 RepID=UPI0013EBD50A|nr:molybdopterin-dependent oxidoreductase [Adlercreutzia sp. ZJ154]